MTDFIYYIRSDSTTGGDGTEDRTDGPTRAFPTFTNAEVTLEGTVNANDRVIVNARAGTYAEALEIDGWTNNGLIIWRALIGHEHLGVIGDGPVISNGTAFVNAIRSREPFVVFEDISATCTTTGNGANCIRVDGADSRVTRCIAGPNSSGNAIGVYITGTRCVVEATLVPDIAGNTYAHFINDFLAGETRNCTIVKSGAVGWQKNPNGGAVADVSNTVAYGSSSNDFNIPGTNVSGDYNASGDTTAYGTNSLTSISDPFTDYTNDDYTISGTGSALYDATDGNNYPGADSYGNSGLDITKTAYTTNDIGCYALSGGPPGQSGSITDSVSLSDVITGLAHKIGQIADSATLTDTITGTVTAGESGIVADQATLTDVIDALMSHIGVAGSTAATADTIQGVAHYLVDLADNVSLTDTIEGSTALSAAIDDAATLSDLISALQGYVGSISESVAVSDVIDGVLGNQIAYINETVVMSISVTGIASYIGNISDHAGMADLIMEMSDDTGDDQDRVVEDVVVDTINDTDSRVEILKDRKVDRRDR